MSHYYFDAFVLILSALAVYAAYYKGCRDTWRRADELTQVEPLLPQPPAKEPQPIELPKWSGMVLTINCRECQDEQEQAL